MSCQWCAQWRRELGRVSLALAENHRAGREMVRMAVEVEAAHTAELARLTAVVEAARALHATGCFGYPSEEYLALGAALSALDGSDRG